MTKTQENQPSEPTSTLTSPKIEVTPSSTGPQPVRSADGDVKPRITVVGVGGAGCNAVNNMIRSQLEGVEFTVMNTDAQALQQSLADRRVHLGDELTQGLGAGSSPDTGRAAAEESHDTISKEIRGSNMVFIAAGMGGGTGTGSAPVIARAARDLGILTVGVVTKPFNFEGAHRMRTAEKGIAELQKDVDTLIVIPNQNLFRVANENTTFADAFKMADDVLYAGVRSITDLMIMPGLINLDFADVRTVMNEMGKAMMGTGEADGEGRAIAAAEAAISNPLLDDVSIRGAQGVLISITGGMDMTLFEVDEAANRIREEVEVDANIIFGSTFDDRLNGRVRVSVVATGIEGGAPAPRVSGVRPSKAESESAVLNLTEDANPFGSGEETNTKTPSESETTSLATDLDLGGLEEDLKTSRPSLFGEEDDDQDEGMSLYGAEDGPLELKDGDDSDSEEAGASATQPLDLLESSQMEIKFESPEELKEKVAAKKKAASSGGNFLSRFLRGRSKSEQAVAPKSPPTFSSLSSPEVKLDEGQDDHLDVPTFMRKGGGRE